MDNSAGANSVLETLVTLAAYSVGKEAVQIMMTS